MAFLRKELRALAKSIAQDPAGSVPTAKLLLADPDDYNTAILLALEAFTKDKPNRRIVHYTAIAPGFRFVLYGSGAILTGVNAWAEGESTIDAVYLGYDTNSDGNEPLDRSLWRQRAEPSAEILELRGVSIVAGQVLRLEYFVPYVVSEDAVTSTTVKAGHKLALATLVAHHLCSMTARRYVQNTGTSSFQNETVDRRSQSDMMASRAKDLLTAYGTMVGKGQAETLAPAGIKRTLEIDTSHRRGRLWPH